MPIPAIALMMEAEKTYETSVNLYESTRLNIPEGSHLIRLLLFVFFQSYEYLFLRLFCFRCFFPSLTLMSIVGSLCICRSYSGYSFNLVSFFFTFLAITLLVSLFRCQEQHQKGAVAILSSYLNASHVHTAESCLPFLMLEGGLQSIGWYCWYVEGVGS